MKKIPALLVAAFLLVFPVSGYSGYATAQPVEADNPGFGERMVSDNWNLSFSGTGLGSEQRETGVTNHSFGDYSVEVEGVLRVPNPCYGLESEVAEVGEKYELRVSSVNQAPPGTSCTQVVSYQKYTATLETDNPFKLDVVHDNSTVDTLTHPELETEKPGNSSDGHNSLFQQLTGFFSSIFS